jgi:hypothetical protein
MKRTLFSSLNGFYFLACILFIFPITTFCATQATNELCAKVGYLENWSAQKVLALPKNKRPPPCKYLSPWYMAEHLMLFKEGGAFLIPSKFLNTYGRDLFGRADGRYIMPKYQMDNLLKKAKGDLSIVEKELGIPAGFFGHQKISRIDIPYPQKLNIRMPTGKESGTNDEWLPGGLLSNCLYNEAVIDPIPRGQYEETPIN